MVGNGCHYTLEPLGNNLETTANAIIAWTSFLQTNTKCVIEACKVFKRSVGKFNYDTGRLTVRLIALLLHVGMHARSGVKQWVLSVSESVCHQNFGLITTTKGLYTFKRHSNSGNSDKT